jgi:hypothetical protein
VRVGDQHRAFKKAGLFHPGSAGHFAVAVESEPAGEDRVGGSLAAGEDGGDAGAHRPCTDAQLSFTFDDGAVAHFDAGHIGDGVERAGDAVERHTEVAGAWFVPSGSNWG